MVEKAVQMNIDEVLVENVISNYGLRQVHVIRQGNPVDALPWSEMVPEDAWELKNLYAIHEEELDVHHLYVVWNARELVDLSKRAGAPLRYGVLWFIAPGETVSWAVELAACRYERIFHRWPTRAWMLKVDAAYPEEILLDCGELLKLEQGAWMPQERYVCVGIVKEEFDPIFDLDMSYREVKSG